MPLSNPWLAGPSPDHELPQRQLEDRVLDLLSTQNLAVIATVNSGGSPTATPVRYYSLGFEIDLLCELEHLGAVSPPAP